MEYKGRYINAFFNKHFPDCGYNFLINNPPIGVPLHWCNWHNQPAVININTFKNREIKLCNTFIDQELVKKTEGITPAKGGGGMQSSSDQLIEDYVQDDLPF